MFVVWTGLADRRRFPDWSLGFDDVDDWAAAGRPPRNGAAGPSRPALVDVHGTAEQQDYLRRRDAALQKALIGGGQLIRTLGIVLDGHDPEVVTRPGQPSQLCCRRCRAPTGGVTPFPCPAAQDALHALETDSG
ncbi:hypothetical protein GCM10009616_15080 [Microlunatus lacustris]